VADKTCIIYAGTPDFSVAPLQALLDAPEYEVIAVYTQPDRPAGRGQGTQASPVKLKALEYGINVYQPVSLKDESAQQVLEALHADLMVVTAYGLLLPEAVLAMPRLGCINIHASLLPRWRGAAPIQRAIIAGDNTTGITIMHMDKGLDTGDMLALASCQIRDDDTGSSLHDRLMSLGANTLMSALPKIIEQSIEPQVQDDALANYASKLSKAEAEIDWSLSAESIERLVRGFNSWPVAFSSFTKKTKKGMSRQTLRVWQAVVIDERVDMSKVQAGTVIAESSEGIDVATGDGVLRLQTIQPQGKRQMPAADFLNANSLLQQVLGQ